VESYQSQVISFYQDNSGIRSCFYCDNYNYMVSVSV